jgi:amidase
MPTLDRRRFLQAALAAGAGALASSRLRAAHPGASASGGPALPEADLSQVAEGLASGRWTSEGLVKHFLERIRRIDPKIHAVLEVNPEALAIARSLDRERREKGPRGPLHGIPVLLKDNIDTADRMRTTAGSLALAEAPAPARDAAVAERLRAAGAVLLGKTNLSEWANMRSTHSTSGWSGRGGLTRNPHVLDRNCSGSSSGSGAAVAAGLCSVAVGTETDGSIVSPAATCGVVGLKPTLGLVSRSGIIPISHSQDTAGPMARCVRDAAILLGALAGADPRDPATAGCRPEGDYARFLDAGGLKGARLGVARNFFPDNRLFAAEMERALQALRAGGATLVDVEVPTADYEKAELEVLLRDFKADLKAYFDARPGCAVRDMATLVAWNEAHADREMPYFGQELLVQAQAKGPLTDTAYRTALDTCRTLSRRGILDPMERLGLDALVAPTGTPAWPTDLANGDNSGLGCSTPAAVAGFPHITVPAGWVLGLPVGLSFFGRAWSEPVLLRLAYAFEQATRARRAPRFLTTV